MIVQDALLDSALASVLPGLKQGILLQMGPALLDDAADNPLSFHADVVVDQELEDFGFKSGLVLLVHLDFLHLVSDNVAH